MLVYKMTQFLFSCTLFNRKELVLCDMIVEQADFIRRFLFFLLNSENYASMQTGILAHSVQTLRCNYRLTVMSASRDHNYI